MPGKYSHSVVLADYSSRGMISLPNDQHIAYLRSSPYATSQHSRQGSKTWSQSSPSSERRSQSACAFSNPSNRAVSSFKPRVIVDDDDVDNGQKESARPQQPSFRSRSQQNFRVASKPTLGRQFEDSIHTQTTDSRAAVKHVEPVQRHTNTAQQQKTILDRNHGNVKISAEDFLRETSSPSTSPNAKKSPPIPPRSATLRPQVIPKLKSAVEIRRGPDILPESKPILPTTRPRTSDAPQPSKALRHQASQETQIYNPRPAATTAVVEPNFDGFSDLAEQQSSYFDKPSEIKPTVLSKALPATPDNLNRADTSPPTATSRLVESRARTLQSVSTEPSDSDVLPEGTISPFDSHSKVNSLTSMSTLSSREVSIPVRGIKQAALKKVTNQAPNHNWQLPEIDEDSTFDPDIFLQGPDDLVPQVSSDGSVDSFANRPLGTISAGRDVDFSRDDDSDGEGEAACPPDIGRYRNEDDFEMPTISQNKKSEGAAGRNLTWSGRTPKAGENGLLARFKARRKVYFG